MSESGYVLAIAICLVILVSIEFKVISPNLAGLAIMGRFTSRRGPYGILIDKKENVGDILQMETSSTQEPEVEPWKNRFSVIIVSYNEDLLNKTSHWHFCLSCRIANVLENTRPDHLYEAS